MNKFIIIVIALYLLYYLGNIVFDVFLKKENAITNEESEEFSLADISENIETKITEIGIEDVENLNTPKSFTKSESQISEEISESEQEVDIETLRKKFEAEEDIENFGENDEQSFQKEVETSENKKTSNENIQENIAEQNPISKIKNHWKNLLNLAETSVQMFANNDGSRIYQSVM